MIINVRTIEVYNYILDNPEKTIKEIAEDMSIVERKIRYEIENLNFLLSLNNIKYRIMNFEGKISIEKNNETIKFYKTLHLFEKPSQEQRRNLIIFKYIVEERTNIKKLSEEFKVSRTTIKKDLKYIKERFLNENSVEELSEYENEIEIRIILVKILLKYIGTLMLKIKNNIVAKFIEKNFFNVNRKIIKKFLEEISEEKLLKNEFYDFFYSYMIISIFRIKSGKRIVSKILNEEFLRSTKEYGIIEKYINIVEKENKIIFNENERLHLSDYLIGFFSYSYNTKIFEKWIEVNLIIKNMIYKLEKETGINFSEDKVLLEGLLNHIKPAIYRAKNGIYLEQIEIYFNESEYLDKNLLKKVEEEVKKIENLLDIKFKKEETILFTVHFQVSMERIFEKRKQNKKVLLMCIGGYGTTTILVYKLKEKYDLKELKLISYLELSDINLKEYDAIITTINLKKSIQESLNIKVIKVSPFLIEEDIRKLDSYFNKRKVKKIEFSEILKSIEKFVEIKDKRGLKKSLEKLLFDRNQEKWINRKIDNDKEKIFENLYDNLNSNNVRYIKEKFRKWEDIIDVGVKVLKENKKVNMNYAEDIKSLIKNFGSYMVITENVAIPHSETNKNVYEKGIALLVLKYPIFFPKNKKVKILFFLSSKERKDNIKIIEDILKLIDGYNFKERVKKIESNQALMKLINQIKNEVNKIDGENK
jgi:putative phosphotransferase system mannitol/fructose-specific IIA domain-containing protein (fragment)